MWVGVLRNSSSADDHDDSPYVFYVRRIVFGHIGDQGHQYIDRHPR